MPVLERDGVKLKFWTVQIPMFRSLWIKLAQRHCLAQLPEQIMNLGEKKWLLCNCVKNLCCFICSTVIEVFGHAAEVTHDMLMTQHLLCIADAVGWRACIPNSSLGILFHSVLGNMCPSVKSHTSTSTRWTYVEIRPLFGYVEIGKAISRKQLQDTSSTFCKRKGTHAHPKWPFHGMFWMNFIKINCWRRATSCWKDLDLGFHTLHFFLDILILILILVYIYLNIQAVYKYLYYGGDVFGYDIFWQYQFYCFLLLRISTLCSSC